MEKTEQLRQVLREAAPATGGGERGITIHGSVYAPVTIIIGSDVTGDIAPATVPVSESVLTRRRRQLADLPPFQPNKE